MTPQDFLKILAQNHKVSQQFIEDAMYQNGWICINMPNSICFTDGLQHYRFDMPVNRAMPTKFYGHMCSQSN